MTFLQVYALLIWLLPFVPIVAWSWGHVRSRTGPVPDPRARIRRWKGDAEPAERPAPPPDGVCVERASDGVILGGADPKSLPCEYHGVDPGVDCPSQSPRPHVDPLGTSLLEMRAHLRAMGVKVPVPASDAPPVAPATTPTPIVATVEAPPPEFATDPKPAIVEA